MNRTLLMAWALPCLILAPALAQAGQQVYAWVDEHGVRHYSDEAPPAPSSSVQVMQFERTNAPDYDPVTYEYSILNQVERSAARWAERERKQAQRRESERAARAPRYLEEPMREYFTTEDWWYPRSSYPGYPAYYHGKKKRRYYARHHDAQRSIRQHYRSTRQLPQFRVARRYAHPNRSHQRPGAHLRHGILAQRTTHRYPSYYPPP